jgi:hypothetical protein
MAQGVLVVAVDLGMPLPFLVERMKKPPGALAADHSYESFYIIHELAAHHSSHRPPTGHRFVGKRLAQ